MRSARLCTSTRRSTCSEPYSSNASIFSESFFVSWILVRRVCHSVYGRRYASDASRHHVHVLPYAPRHLGKNSHPWCCSISKNCFRDGGGNQSCASGRMSAKKTETFERIIFISAFFFSLKFPTPIYPPSVFPEKMGACIMFLTFALRM